MCADDVIDALRAARPNICKLGKCVDFAGAAQQALVKAGISGKRIRISDGGAVGFGNTRLATNGVHEFIQVGGRVFDNLTSTSAKEFFKRFAVTNPNFKTTVTDF